MAVFCFGGEKIILETTFLGTNIPGSSKKNPSNKTTITHQLSLSQSTGQWGSSEFGVNLIGGVCLLDHLGAGAVWDVELELGQTKSLELDGLSGHTNGGTINKGSVLVDNINDGNKLASEITKINQSHTADFNQVFGRLQTKLSVSSMPTIQPINCQFQ